MDVRSWEQSWTRPSDAVSWPVENTDALWEEVACNLCGADDAAHLFSAPERRFGLGRTFRIVRCRRCGLVYLNPRPTARGLRRYYPGTGYYAYKPPASKHNLASRVRYWGKQLVLAQHKGYPFGSSRWMSLSLLKVLTFPLKGRFQAVPPFVSNGRILDIGCGSGRFLLALRELGWDTYGVEIHEEAARLAQQQLGLRVFCGSLQEANFPDAFFNVVRMRHVLEHLSDPVGALNEVNRILVGTGELYVEVPNVESLQPRIFKDRWFHLDVPRHLYFFAAQTLGALLAKTGFDVAQASFVPSTSGITGSLQYLWNERTRDPSGNRIRWSKALNGVLWPLAFLLARLGQGDIIRVIAVKEGHSGSVIRSTRGKR